MDVSNMLPWDGEQIAEIRGGLFDGLALRFDQFPESIRLGRYTYRFVIDGPPFDYEYYYDLELGEIGS